MTTVERKKQQKKRGQGKTSDCNNYSPACLSSPATLSLTSGSLHIVPTMYCVRGSHDALGPQGPQSTAAVSPTMHHAHSSHNGPRLFSHNAQVASYLPAFTCSGLLFCVVLFSCQDQPSHTCLWLNDLDCFQSLLTSSLTPAPLSPLE